MLENVPRIIQAPMAGGPSTPELAAAVSGAGGLGFLAGGYLTAESLLGAVRAARALTHAPLGVNLFVPGPPAADVDAVAAYRERLVPHADLRGVRLPAVADLPWDDDDHYRAKLDALCALPAPPELVSFTFGLPGHDDVARLRALGTLTVATVTNEGEARAAVALDVDGICVQGPEAGGHRGTHDAAAAPDDRPLEVLLPAVIAALSEARRRPHITATGGIDTPRRVREVLELGADSAMAGTAYLRADEAGTNATHAAALATAGRDTLVTRAFTGRTARGLANTLALEVGSAAPSAYPAVHHLTRPLRAAAASAGDPERLHLWAGTNYAGARPAPAAAITRWLAGGTDPAIATVITDK
ncbi:NAD(P)H-dependent flavin oxidoreductase [Zhihengliuella halotolerans]|uniref:Propionate 3-nitronate monooxygenase n=1 Tax=Zhihengliuella halotolerans TaxID=370736 RepID=A0A4Q8AC34_9MICC|nr:nitronate monooxygenase [Zhihengliuella halotolerans]RZU61175.1 nitroalkane oxidase [Zhihengliuella halotolerans]